MQENLKAKYGTTTEELKNAASQIKWQNIKCNDRTRVSLIDLVANGDIAGTAKPEILFKSSEHELFYNKMLAMCRDNDCYHRALIYTLGINEDTRKHINEIYDFSSLCINSEVLRAGWITSGTVRALRLAFNLFTGNTFEENSRQDNYSVTAIFEYGDAEYFFQAIKLRYNY